MPFAPTSDGSIYYEFDASPELPVLVLANSLGTDLQMWKPQLELLRKHFSLLRYDTRGHGKSSVPVGPYTIEQMGRDVINLLDHLGLSRVHFCGLSLGGMVAQWLGIHASERIDRLVLSNTAARIGTNQTWNQRIHTVKQGGMDTIFPSILNRWFTPRFRASHETDVEAIAAVLRKTNPAGYIACCEALREADFQAQISNIPCPTLILFGAQDTVTTANDARFLERNIPQSHVEELDAAHLANVEAATAWTDAVIRFCSSRLMTDSQRYEEGMKTRRKVLGDAHVDRSIAARTAFDGPFQDLITRYAWGEIWSRPGLSRHTRSLITLALMISLNREEEFKMHVRASFNNGVSEHELQEVLLHCAIYCGLPAVNNAFQWASNVLAQMSTSLHDNEAGKNR